MDLSKITTEDILTELADRIDIRLVREQKDKTAEAQMYLEMSKIKNIYNILDQLAATYMKIYFKAPDDESRNKAKGAFETIKYIQGNIITKENIK